MGNTSVALSCKEEALPATSGLVMVFEVDGFEAPEDPVYAMLQAQRIGSSG